MSDATILYNLEHNWKITDYVEIPEHDGGLTFNLNATVATFDGTIIPYERINKLEKGFNHSDVYQARIRIMNQSILDGVLIAKNWKDTNTEEITSTHKVEVINEEVIRYILGSAPSYRQMQIKLIMTLGRYVGGHHDKWEWDERVIREQPSDVLDKVKAILSSNE